MSKYKLYHLSCTECGMAHMFSWQPLPQPEVCLCYLCMHSICDITDGFVLNDGLSAQDLYRVQNENGIEHQEVQSWRMRVMRFKNRIFKAKVAIKISQLEAKKQLDKRSKVC